MIMNRSTPSPQFANLYNPAFCSVVLSKFIAGYCKNNENMPYSISLLALTLVFFPNMEKLVPRSPKATKLHVWLSENPEVKLNFASRVSKFVEVTEASLFWGISNGLIWMNDKGHLLIDSKKRIKDSPVNSEAAKLRALAEKLGTWFGISGEEEFIYTVLGVTL